MKKPIVFLIAILFLAGCKAVQETPEVINQNQSGINLWNLLDPFDGGTPQVIRIFRLTSPSNPDAGLGRDRFGPRQLPEMLT